VNCVTYVHGKSLSYVLLNSLLFYDREGQPLKLPDTKRTLLFTFNGKCSAS